METLSAPARSKFLMSSRLRTPPPTVRGTKHSAENSLIETPWLTARQLEEARVQAYREYYYRPRYILGEALKVRRLADVRRLLRGAGSVRARLKLFREAADKQHG